MILILTNADDPHADAVAEVLAERGVAYRRLDPADYAGPGLTVRFGSDGTVRRRIGDVELDGVTGVWWRRPGTPGEAKPLAGTPIGVYAAQETHAVLWDVLDSLDVRVVPAPYLIVHRAQQKLRQLRIAGELGFTVPATLVTDDPEALLEFAAAHPKVITKQATPGLPRHTADDVSTFRYTEVLHPVDLLNVDALTLCPMTAQRYVSKQVELRVTVVGERVLTVAIHSQGTRHTRDDWRRYDNGHTSVEPFDLPPEQAARCVALTRALGLCYSTIDLIMTPEGRYVFLELNPNGQYLWLENLTGLPMSAAVADLLTTTGVPA